MTLAGSVFAFRPVDPLAVLDHEGAHGRFDVLAVIVIGDLADERIRALDAGEILRNLHAVGSHVLNSLDELLHGHIGEGAVGFGGFLEVMLLVARDELRAAGQLFNGSALDEAHRALSHISTNTGNKGVGLDAGAAFKLTGHSELGHLGADTHAYGNKAAEVEHIRIQGLYLGELGSEVLLVGVHAEGADNLAAELLEELRKVLSMALAVVRDVMNDGDIPVAFVIHEFGGLLVLVDHGAGRTEDFLVVIAVGDIRLHGAPYNGRHLKAVVDAHSAKSHGGTVMRNGAHHLSVGGGLGGYLDADVGFALVVIGRHLVQEFGIGILIGFLNGELSRIAAAHAQRGKTAGQGADEAHFDGFLGKRLGRSAEERGGETGYGSLSEKFRSEHPEILLLLYGGARAMPFDI